MKNRIFLIILSLVIIITAFPLAAVKGFAEDNIIYTSQDGLWKYKKIDNNTIIIDNSRNSSYSKAYLGSEKNVVIPNTIDGYLVVSLGWGAFCYCASLTNITIPDSVTSIGDNAFSDCTSLESVTIPDSVTSIGWYAFESCTSLTSIAIPDSVTSIGAATFRGCTSLENITIPDSVTSIGWNAFKHCTSLESITIPDSVTSIEEAAFDSCTLLKNITVGVNNAFYFSQDGVLFNKSKTELICYPAGKINTAYAISDSVTSIDGCAFSGCTSLTSITIPDSVTSIGNMSFYNCTSLESVTIGNSVTSIGDFAFLGCTSLTSITIPDSVTSIGYYLTFSGCTSLTSAIIGNGVTSIGHCAFSGCTSLTSITIPDSVISIDKNAFADCSSLTIYCFKGSYAETYAKNNGIPFIIILNPKKGDIDGDGEKTISDYSALKTYLTGASYNSEQFFASDINSDGAVDAFDLFELDKLMCNFGLTDFNYTVTSGNNAKITGYNAADVNVKIPARIDGYTITNVDNYAFKNNSIITSVKLSKGIKTINYGAFLNCTALETVELSNSVTSIGTYAFKGCSNLSKITIPASVTSINANSFTDCPNVTIYGTAGSYAQTYANNNSIDFVAI